MLARFLGRFSRKGRVVSALVGGGLACGFVAQGGGSGAHVPVIETVVAIALFVISLSVHEAAHAWVADLRGDSTARDLGRLTLNPIAHVDLFLTILLPAAMLLFGMPPFGGAKPVPVNYHRLRHPLRDMALVAIAGPASNFAQAIVFVIALKLAVYVGDYESGQMLTEVLVRAAEFNILLAVFNLLPIPPLDGSRVLAWLLPAPLREPYVALERIGMLLVIGFMYFVPGTRSLIVSGMREAREIIDLLTGGVW